MPLCPFLTSVYMEDVSKFLQVFQDKHLCKTDTGIV